MPLNPDDFRRRDTPDLIEAYLRAAFGGSVPAAFGQILDLDLAARHLLSFKFGPVFPVGASRPIRLTVSGVGEEESWAQRLQDRWPHPDLSSFLSAASDGSRKMVDWDGGGEATVYLDDLQDVPHDFAHGSEDVIMCATFHTGNGRRGIITRHASPPVDRLPSEWTARVEALLQAGATGLWGVRWEEGEVAGVLVVTETRSWRGIQPMVALAEKLGGDGRLQDCEDVLGQVGLMPYPDSIELRPDGSYDLTLAVIEREV